MPQSQQEQVVPATRRRILLLILNSVLVLMVVRWVWSYHARFGGWPTYGCHVAVVQQHEDIGIPGLQYCYGMSVQNLTILPLRMEATKVPGGYWRAVTLFHTGVEAWNDRTNSWTIARQIPVPGGELSAYPQTAVTIWPGSSAVLAGCQPLGLQFHKGDSLRFVAYTKLAEPNAPGQKALYSSRFTIQDERAPRR